MSQVLSALRVGVSEVVLDSSDHGPNCQVQTAAVARMPMQRMLPRQHVQPIILIVVC